MAPLNEFKVEVAYATPEQQIIIPIWVESGTTIQITIERSGIMERFPEIDLSRQKVGIFSKVRALSDVVNAGDRIEIYRGLTMDPKDARRKRAVEAGQILRKKGARRQMKPK